MFRISVILSARDLRLQLVTEIEQDVELDLTHAFVPDHQKAFSIRRDVVSGMASTVSLVRAVEKDFGYSHSERRLAHYQILERLGAGGMGEVCLGRDLKLDRDVGLHLLFRGGALREATG